MITTGIHNVTSVHIGEAEARGLKGSHVYAVRRITIGIGDEDFYVDLYADTVESLSLPAERIPVTE